MNTDKVYVIYFDGEMYGNSSRKIVYLTQGRAKQVVTIDSTRMAVNKYNYEEKHDTDFYNLSEQEQEDLINIQKSKFQIKAFVPEEKII